MSSRTRDRSQVLLADCMAAIIDYRGKTPRKTSSGIPLITAKIVKNGRIEEPNEFVDPEEYDDWMRRGLPETGDILITTEAPMGEVAQIGFPKVALAQRLILLRGKPGLLDNTYLKYALMSSEVQSQLHSRTSGTTVVGIKQSELRKICLSLPPLPDQLAIASVLGSLDDKIELNRRMNRTLERMAAAIFKAWFVDFEPVRAKASGAASFPGMPQPVFDALPATFADSEFGPIPEGWEARKVSDFAELSKASVKPQEHADEVFDHFSIPAFDGGQTPSVDSGESIKSNKFAVIDGSILVSKLNPRIPRVWLPPASADRRQIASTEFLVVVPKDEWARAFLWCQFRQPLFADDMSQRASGTSGSHQRVKPGDFMSMAVIQPSSDVVEAFATLVVPKLRLIEGNRTENRTLAETRDALLPKLLSGEVRLPINADESAPSVPEQENTACV